MISVYRNDTTYGMYRFSAAIVTASYSVTCSHRTVEGHSLACKTTRIFPRTDVTHALLAISMSMRYCPWHICQCTSFIHVYLCVLRRLYVPACSETERWLRAILTCHHFYHLHQYFLNKFYCRRYFVFVCTYVLMLFFCAVLIHRLRYKNEYDEYMLFCSEYVTPSSHGDRRSSSTSINMHQLLQSRFRSVSTGRWMKQQLTEMKGDGDPAMTWPATEWNEATTLPATIDLLAYTTKPGDSTADRRTRNFAGSQLVKSVAPRVDPFHAAFAAL